jgi:hypothetical protein
LRCGRRVPAPLSAVRGVHGSRATAAAAGPRASRAAVAHGDRRAGRACVSLFGGSSTAAKCRSRRKRWGRCRHPLMAHERRAAPPAQDGCLGADAPRRPMSGGHSAAARCWARRAHSVHQPGRTPPQPYDVALSFWERHMYRFRRPAVAGGLQPAAPRTGVEVFCRERSHTYALKGKKREKLVQNRHTFSTLFR